MARKYLAFTNEIVVMLQSIITHNLLIYRDLEGGSALRSDEWTTTPVPGVKQAGTRKPDSVLLNMQRPIEDCLATSEYQRQR